MEDICHFWFGVAVGVLSMLFTIWRVILPGKRKKERDCKAKVGLMQSRLHNQKIAHSKERKVLQGKLSQIRKIATL